VPWIYDGVLIASRLLEYPFQKEIPSSDDDFLGFSWLSLVVCWASSVPEAALKLVDGVKRTFRTIYFWRMYFCHWMTGIDDITAIEISSLQAPVTMRWTGMMAIYYHNITQISTYPVP